MNEPDYEFHDSQVISVLVKTDVQPVRIIFEIHSHEKKVGFLYFDVCYAVEGRILGVFADPEWFNFIQKDDVADEYKGLCSTNASTYWVHFTGGSKIKITAESYSIRWLENNLKTIP